MKELLERINDALATCTKEGATETSITLTYGELLLFRRYEMVSDYDLKIATQNLRMASAKSTVVLSNE